ncbi:hypothetical protein A2U01_0046489, partial [Trifolium medium]|nr:hypothetical protein [Trifolium medium]
VLLVSIVYSLLTLHASSLMNDPPSVLLPPPLFQLWHAAAVLCAMLFLCDTIPARCCSFV